MFYPLCQIKKVKKKFYPNRLFGPGRLFNFDLFSTLEGYLALDVCLYGT